MDAIRRDRKDRKGIGRDANRAVAIVMMTGALCVRSWRVGQTEATSAGSGINAFYSNASATPEV
jgi:hypothetical protein